MAGVTHTAPGRTIPGSCTTFCAKSPGKRLKAAASEANVEPRMGVTVCWPMVIGVAANSPGQFRLSSASCSTVHPSNWATMSARAPERGVNTAAVTPLESAEYGMTSAAELASGALVLLEKIWPGEALLTLAIDEIVSLGVIV